MNDLLIVWPLVLPVVGGLLVSSKRIITPNRLKPFVAFIAILNFILVALANQNASNLILHVLTVNEFLDIYLHIDQLGKLFSYMGSFLWIITSFYSFEYMKHEGSERRYFVYFLVTLGVIMGISYSGNLFTLYIYYELLTLTTFPLVIHAGSGEALQSGKKYIIYSFVGATFIVLGMMILFSITGNMNFVGGGIASFMDYPDRSLILISFLSMFIGFGVKAAMVPLHSWLPAAMVAPTPVSALLHAVAVVKSGIFALTRITYFLFGPVLIKAMHGDRYLIPLAVATIVMGSMIALHQDHLKKRLAYSTISQLGYIVLGLLMLNPDALTGAMLHLIAHAFIKITLFFVVGAITYQTGYKYIHQINGLGKQMKKTFLAFLIAAISLVGIPPTNGFVSKWYLGIGSMANSQALFIVILLFSAFLTAAYLFPVAIAGFFRNPDPETTQTFTDPAPMMMWPIIALGVVVIVQGLFPNVIIDFIGVIVADVF